ncbi:hypothetical protein [Terriglobus saanensis]|nr:hypothetical protein [Terriglobus saanensis]
MPPKQPYTETPHVEMEPDSTVHTHAGIPHQSIDGTEVVAKETSTKVPHAGTTEEDLPWYREADMLKRIVAIVAVVVVGYLCYLGYNRYKTNRDVAAGEVVSDDQNQPVTPSEGDSKPAHVTQPSSMSAVTSLSAPKIDTIAPNPPNGRAFTGTGKFQVYRQGNITWRVNTESGESCILLATQQEWRKPIVYNHGCNAS